MQQNESLNLLKSYVQLLVEDDVSGRYRLPSEELTSSEKVAKEKYEAAEAELKAWNLENKKKEAFIAKCKELGVSPTSDSKVVKALKNKPEYNYNVKLLQKQKKTLEDAFEKAKDEYALYEPSISGFQRKQNISNLDSEKVLPEKDVKTYVDIKAIKPLKFYRWDDPRWDNPMKTTKYGGDAGVGLGPGEARIAKIIGGKVQGSGVSFDVVAKDGSAWEIKAFDSASSLIRPGAKGRVAFDGARSRLVSILRQLRNFVTVSKKLDIITSDAEVASSITFIEGFLNDEIDSILGKGEISRSRIKALYTVMKIASQIIKKWSNNSTAKPIDTKLSFNNKTVKVDKSTYIDVAKKVQRVVGNDVDILGDFESQELAIATLNDEAFKNPAKFFDVWFDSVKASTVFAGVDGMFIVTGAGFIKIPAGLFNKVLKFDSVSQNLPKFNFVLVDDLQM